MMFLVPTKFNNTYIQPPKTENTNLDEDLVRIKSKIDLLKNTLNQGPLSYLINIFVSLMVTMEVTNGIEKITIQEILTIFKTKIDNLDLLFDELQFSVKILLEKKEKNNNSNDIDKEITTKKTEFRTKIYRLFDLNEILLTTIRKCVVLGAGINKILPLLTDYFSKLTVQTIDSILLTNTDIEFETMLWDYLLDRVDSIKDPFQKKMKKITILNNLMNRVVGEKIGNNKTENNIINIEMKKL
jgi:hypothetical protein